MREIKFRAWDGHNRHPHWIYFKLEDGFPVAWHHEHNIPYVTADLIKLADGMERYPGRIEI